MALILFKWLFVAFLASSPAKDVHPIYMSVTEIEHNAKEETLEISCRIFTDDFEQTLRKTNRQRIDLLDAKQRTAMNAVVSEYVQKHLKINVNGTPAKMIFIGFEQIEEGISCYFNIVDVPVVKQLVITDNILYEYKQEQISILHVTVNGNRKSTKMNNPQDEAVFNF